MFNVRHRVLLYVLLTAVVSLTPALRANHSWGAFHWARTANPFALAIGDNVSTTWDGHLAIARADWDVSDVLTLAIVPGGTRPKTCRPTAGRIEVCNAAYGNTGWLGVAQVWASGSHITQATAKMNDSYFSAAPYNTPAWRQLVMCQEVAHDFGLGHQDENFNNANLGSCMDYTNDPASNQHPNGHDYDQLRTIYAHLDSTTTAGAATQMGAPAVPLDLDSPAQWGRVVGTRANGRIQIFERDFGNDRKVLTHVFWADPTADSH